MYVSFIISPNPISKKIVEKWGTKPLPGKKLEQLPEFPETAKTLHILPGQNKKAYQNFISHLEDNNWVITMHNEAFFYSISFCLFYFILGYF